MRDETTREWTFKDLPDEMKKKVILVAGFCFIAGVVSGVFMVSGFAAI